MTELNDPQALSPQQHIALLRDALSQVRSITNSNRRTIRDGQVLIVAQQRVEMHLLALEIWAAKGEG